MSDFSTPRLDGRAEDRPRQRTVERWVVAWTVAGLIAAGLVTTALWSGGARASHALTPLPPKEQVPPTTVDEEEEKEEASASKFAKTLSDAAMERTQRRVVYDPQYVSMSYPGGDVPDNRGVCSDVIIRVYRKAGVDLQKEVHEDMSANFSKYPKLWGLTRPDKNIDHRRVQNLQCYFKRHDAERPSSKVASEYEPGDVVAWRLKSGLHIGLVVEKMNPQKTRHMVVHNYGRGPELGDYLFRQPIVGHYRYLPETKDKTTD